MKKRLPNKFRNKENDALRRYNYMAIFKINCFNKKMIVKNRLSSKTSVYSFGPADKIEEFEKLNEEEDDEETEKSKNKEESEPKWMNESIRNLFKTDHT